MLNGVSGRKLKVVAGVYVLAVIALSLRIESSGLPAALKLVLIVALILSSGLLNAKVFFKH